MTNSNALPLKDIRRDMIKTILFVFFFLAALIVLKANGKVFDAFKSLMNASQRQ